MQKAGGTSHLKGSRLGCLYQPILPGFYSGDERVLKTNRTLRKKLVEQMTVFLVAKPSVLLQQLTEGSAIALDLCVCVFVGVAGAGWRGRRENQGRGEDVSVCWGTQTLRANWFGSGGEKLAVTGCANTSGRGQAWELVCVAVPSVCYKLCVHGPRGPESQQQGGVRSRVRNSAAGSGTPARRWGQRCVFVRVQ